MLIAFAISVLAQSQPKPKNNLFIHWGYSSTRYQDVVFSPMIYEGSTFNSLQLGYERQGEFNSHRLLVELEGSDLSGTENISFIVGDRRTRKASPHNYYRINYRIQRSLTRSERFELFLSGDIDIQAQLLNYQFGLSDDDGFIFAHSISPGVGGSWKLDEKNKFTIMTSYPLVSFVARPKYNIVDNRRIQHDGSDFLYYHGEGGFKGPGSYHQLFIQLAYQRYINEKISSGLLFINRSWQYDDPLQMAITKNNLFLAINYHF